MTDAQRRELTEWRNSDAGKAIIADGCAKAKAKRAKLSKGGKEGGNGGGGDSTPKRNSVKYQNQVEKAAKKLLASSLEAEKVEAAAMDAQLDAAIQRRAGADVGATAVVPPTAAEQDAAIEKAVAEKQVVLKLSSVLSRIKVGKTGINAGKR